jgi:hypothetical protein
MQLMGRLPDALYLVCIALRTGFKLLLCHTHSQLFCAKVMIILKKYVSLPTKITQKGKYNDYRTRI